MPTVVNKSQPVISGGMYPMSAYSRMLLFRMRPERVGFMNDFGVTSVIGQRVWILGVDVWFNNIAQAGWMMLENSVMYGVNKDADFPEIRDNWESVLQYSRSGTKSFLYYGEKGHMHFNMKMLLKGQAWRFGFVSQIFGAGVECMVMFGIEIAEG